MEKIETLRFWCQKILPLVYDDSLSYYEVLCKLTDKLNEVIDFVSDVTIDQIKEIMDDLMAEAFYDPETHRITFTIEEGGTPTEAGYVTQLALGNNVYNIKDSTAEPLYDPETDRITFEPEEGGTPTEAGDVTQLAIGNNVYNIKDSTAEPIYNPETHRITFETEEGGTPTEAGDVTQLAIGNNVYNIKDSMARALLNTMPNSEYSHIIVVEKNPEARFTLPSAAVAYAQTLSPSLSNRVLIVIASGIYEDYIDLGNTNGIDLFGIGYVIIRSSVAWRASTLVATGYINVNNINFENRYTPSSGETAGYALHNDPVSATQNFWNCTFYSDNNAAVGCGLGANGSVNFYQCRMTSGSTAGLYFHNRQLSDVYGQWLRCFNCYFEGSTGTNFKSCVMIDDACSMAGGTNSQMAVIFANCSGYPRTMTYRYGSPILVRHFLNRVHSASDNVFLWSSSYCPAIPGLDYTSSQGSFEQIQYSTGNAYRLFYPNAYMFEWDISAVNPADNSPITVIVGTIIANGAGMIPVSCPGYTGAAKFTLNFKPRGNLV